MKEGSTLKDHLDALNSILMDLKNVEVKIDDEDVALILLVSLPPSFENFMNLFVAGKDTITLEDEGHWKVNCHKLKEKGQIAAVAKDDSGSERDAVLSVVDYKSADGVVRTLTDVRHVPDLKKNLISLGVLDSKGFKYTSENGVLRVSKGALVVMKATKSTKGEAFEKFKHWKILIENQTGRRIKRLRTDNGLEFCSREFNDFCRDVGIASTVFSWNPYISRHHWPPSLHKNNTWELVQLRERRKVVGCKWVFKMKTGLLGSDFIRFKPRLVAKGYSQGESTTMRFSPKCDLEEEIYMSQTEGFVVQGFIGSLTYVMVCTRADIDHAVSVVSRYMAHPGKKDWNAVKRIFLYLKGTYDVGLIYVIPRLMTNMIVTTPVNVTGAPVTNTVVNHAKKQKKINGQNFKRWQHKMFFYVRTLNLARYLNEIAPQVEAPKEGQPSNAQAVQAVNGGFALLVSCLGYGVTSSSINSFNAVENGAGERILAKSPTLNIRGKGNVIHIWKT
ncbi:retrovirus-related pol polyprotein from transposon TNT 1-94 [Tanacetum coccineum]